MPHDDPDPTDPMELVAVELAADAATVLHMARTFAGELARGGLGVAELMAVFRNPAYAGAHGAYRALGEPAIRDVVEECVAPFEAFRLARRSRSCRKS